MSIWQQDRPLSYAQTIGHWQHHEPFRTFFIALLARAPFAAYFWETPPLTAATQERPFEFVQVDAPQLACVRANPAPFQTHFDTAVAGEAVIAFPNLGRDAFLVVPRPQAALDAYGHLAVFTRQAPISQQHALWQRVGQALADRLGPDPLWLSTSGLGVYWLHLRLDSRPKYYTYTPYRRDRWR